MKIKPKTRYVQVLYSHPTDPFEEEGDPIDAALYYADAPVPIKVEDGHRIRKTIGHATQLWRDGNKLFSVCETNFKVPKDVRHVAIFTVGSQICKLKEIIWRR